MDLELFDAFDGVPEEILIPVSDTVKPNVVIEKNKKFDKNKKRSYVEYENPSNLIQQSNLILGFILFHPNVE